MNKATHLCLNTIYSKTNKKYKDIVNNMHNNEDIEKYIVLIDINKLKDKMGIITCVLGEVLDIYYTIMDRINKDIPNNEVITKAIAFELCNQRSCIIPYHFSTKIDDISIHCFFIDATTASGEMLLNGCDKRV